MELISIRFQEDILKRMDECIAQNNFNSRTEFIREAVRDKMANLSRDELIEKFMKFRGTSSKTTTDEEREAIRIKVGNEYLAELKQKYNQI